MRAGPVYIVLNGENPRERLLPDEMVLGNCKEGSAYTLY